MWHFWRMLREDGAAAQNFLERAVQMDPGFGAAFAGLAWNHNNHAVHGWTRTPEISFAKALEAARRAVEIDDKDALAHFVLGRVLAQRGEFDAAIAELNRALEINPNFAMAYYGLGFTLIWMGRHVEAIPHIDQAIRQSPNDPLLWAMEMLKCRALHLDRRYDEAVSWGLKACRHPGPPFWAEVMLAAPLVALDRLDEARAALTVAREKNPDVTLALIGARMQFAEREILDDLLEHLRMAGLPEE